MRIREAARRDRDSAITQGKHMRDQAEVSSGVATATHDVDAGALYIITLSSSTAPVALEAPAIPELTGLALFRSKRVEDGRDRFRLHLGYFDSVAAAEAILPVVRRHYPAAWVGPAPTSGMGSLDDTSVAQFKFIRAPKTIVRDEPAPAAPARTASTIQATLVAPRASGSSPPVVAKPAPVPSRPAAMKPAKAVAQKAVAARAAVARNAAAKAAVRVAQQSRAATSAAPRTSRPATPRKQANAVAQRNGVAQVQAGGAARQQSLAPRQVLNLLESGSPRGRAAGKPVLQPMQQAAVIGAIQRFAVQIVWSMDPVDLAQVPKLAIFDAYTLYKVQVDRAGRRWYGLRLGFFSDPVSARQVALYARSDFSAAAVVPVSDRECQRAEQAAITEFPQVEVRKTEDRITLFEDPAPPARNGASRAQPVNQARRNTESARASASPAKQDAAAQRSVERSGSKAKAKSKTTQELAEELVALQDEPDFSGSDPLNDSGVRHLAVNVVKKSRLSSLFSLGSKGKDES